ncbi:MAG: YicC family protein [Burkholderiales bacterium]|nr:YicC family protein [Burkholderiales bacterium]
MIYSMTGYTTANVQLPFMNIQLELKSVNHRFFDLSFRTPDEFRILETPIREIINSKIIRGKIDLRITITQPEQAVAKICINHIKLQNYLDICSQIKHIAPDLPYGSITDILAIPGIIISDTIETEQLRNILFDSIRKLCDDLKDNQVIEGNNLSAVILCKIVEIEDIVAKSLQALPSIIQNYKDKMKNKLLVAFENLLINEPRFQQEFTYFCQKIDVDEELQRLKSHTQQFRQLLKDGGVIGKNIDFLSQEMLREANTFASKSVSITTTEYAVQLKVLIEQIKEQLQNIA